MKNIKGRLFIKKLNNEEVMFYFLCDSYIVSTKWRSLWLWVSSQELYSRRFLDVNAFVSFGNRFFDSNRVSCIHKLELTIISNRIDDDP